MDRSFRCLTLTPVALGLPDIAVATARAGSVGLLDLEFCRDPGRAHDVVKQLLSGTEGEVGLRACGTDPALLGSLLEHFAERPHWLILRADDPEPIGKLIAQLPTVGSRQVLVEVTDIDQLARVDDAPIAGLVARGHEAGGWVGGDTAFILLQKLLSEQARPVYVQGGIGIHGTAACRVAGAAGVVLDDQLLLMPESPLPADWKRQLALLNASDTRALGERLGRVCRVPARMEFGSTKRLQELAERAEAEEAGEASWRQRASEIVGWGSPKDFAWPVGQAVALAVAYRDRYKTTGRLIQSLLDHSARYVETARMHRPLRPDSPLAAAHGTRYPIVQGPMTRVSDSAKFADAVSRAGALPFLALALMRGDQTLDLLRQTKELLGDRPWGVGLLGFIPQELRAQQIRAIWEVQPTVALIAGGRPDQAADFERRGIATYIHVPTAELLRMFLDQGARRFVFEGQECGGHVGPLSSLMLWETQIDLLLEKIRLDEASQVHVLFAGGIHDARSAAMVSAMAAPLVERGMRVGVLMGSAYLFTEEIVASGAVVPEFQAQALACTETINLETGPGHATRCALAPFAHEFYAERRQLIRDGKSAEFIRERLEELNLGRLRIASKGKRREPDQGLVDVDVDTQVRDGMYMIGQVATLKHRLITLEALHRQVSEGSTRLLERQRGQAVSGSAPRPRPSDIAIIGIGTLLPKAQSPEAYWHNIVNKVSGITEIPRERWDWRLYYDPDRQARDKIYSKWGGFLDELPFDPMRYGIPPNSLKSVDPLQLLTLEVVRMALEDAGYADGDFDRENTSVILGASGGLGDLGIQYGVRAEIPRFFGTVSDEIWDRLPEWTEESFAGSLLNVSAGRVANRFDFGGLNFTVDAACASALAAINLAVNELESGRSNLAIAGGVDTLQSPFPFLCFSKTQALSPRGQVRTFDADADGIVISEGLAVVVLKRLADAERAGDRIYAVIKSVAGSSDGKALGLTAPLPEGQIRALNRAHAKAGISPSTLGLIEAHGTGTPVGDRAEVETIVRTLEDANTPARSCALGSVKALVGHTKATAGSAGLIKIALALYHKVLPPHVGVSQPLKPIAASNSPVYLLEDARPWFAHPDYPRRAAVSSFGFGGTNFHAVLEEYGREYRASTTCLGEPAWPCELFLFRAADMAELEQQVGTLRDSLAAGAAPRPRDLAYSLAEHAQARTEGPVAASIVVSDLAQLGDGLDRLMGAMRGDHTAPLPPYVHLASEPAVGAVAFLFPGQGTQYPNMAREAALHLDAVRAALEYADRCLGDRLSGLLTQYIYPPSAYGEAEQEEQRKRLTDTCVAQPAIGAIEAGFLDLAAQLGLRPDMVAGHSYGEFTALHAAGVLSRKDFLTLSGARGRAMAEACESAERGTMAAVQASREEVEAVLRGMDVIVANHNAPRQVVISGTEEAVQEAVHLLKAEAMEARLLPVAGAFHSRLMAPAKLALNTAISAAEINPPRLRTYSNSTAQPYPEAPEAIAEQLGEHLLKPVEFVSQIERMYADGARVFVELGPKAVLSRLVGEILGERRHVAVSFDEGGGLRGLLSALGTLATSGVPLKMIRLYERRDVRKLDLARLAELHGPKPPPPTVWFLSGGCVRPQDDQMHRSGKLPVLTLESAEQAREARVGTPPAPPITQAAETPPSVGQQAATPQGFSGNGEIPPAAEPMAVEALLAYQETMRQFIAVQESVMSRFLGGAPTLTSETPARDSVAAAPGLEARSNAAAAGTPAPTIAVAQPEPSGHTPVAEPTLRDVATTGREDLTALLVQQVSERTGYPAEMLGLELDIEAELGIDSIKRVEILGALHERLPEAIGARIKDQMETLTRVKTLNGILDQLLEGAAEAAPFGTAAESPAAGPGPDREELSALLVQQVSERTGYPAEMLGLELDIEAELGIDSIKRVEILGALHERLPEAIGARIKDQMETLTRVKTLNGILDQLFAAFEPREGAATVAQTKTQRPAVVATRDEGLAEQTIPRFKMQGFSEALRKARQMPLEGLFLVTEDEFSVAPLLARQLEARGARAAVIGRANLGDGNALEAQVRALKADHGPVAGVIHLAALTRQPLPDCLDDWRTACATEVKSLYRVLNFCADDLEGAAARGQGCVLAASFLGGNYGRDDARERPCGGGVLGLVKTAEAEWTGLNAKGLDFDPDMTPADIAAQILAELDAPDGEIEIGFPAGQRTVFRTVPAAHDETLDVQLAPSADWVVLVTGGARGITAEIASELGQPGMHFVIVGRTPPPGDESADTAGTDDIDSLRKVFIARPSADGATLNPATIDREVHKLLAEREMRRNLARFRDAGVEVEYRALDVRDEAAFGALIDSIYETYGRLDAVLHGAGVIEDKLIAHKTPESFDRVFDTKVDSAFVLSHRLRSDSLKLLVLFASVAGRYGNRGQSDYAAANEVINRLAWHLHSEWPDTRVVAINWGPWNASGMVSEEVKRQFRERGIVPVDVLPGRRFFAEELRYGRKADVELIGGIGPWQREAPAEQPPSQAAPAPAAVGGSLPLLTMAPEVLDDGTVIVEHTFDLATHSYLNDHRLDGIPVLPAAAALEWIAQFVQAHWSDWVVHKIGDLRVLKGIRLDNGDSKCALFRARVSSHADAESLKVSVEILDRATGRPYYKGVATLVPQIPEPLDNTWEPMSSGEPLDSEMAYRNYLFHGPCFQLLTNIYRLGPEGIDAEVLPSEPLHWLNGQAAEPTGETGAANWLFDPGLVDASLQLAMIWSRVRNQTTPLPGYFGTVARYGSLEITDPLQLHFRLKPRANDNLVVYDAVFVDRDGKVRLYMENIENPCSRALNRLKANA